MGCQDRKALVSLHCQKLEDLNNKILKLTLFTNFLLSKDALEVMFVSHSSVYLANFTDVTQVSEDTEDHDDPDVNEDLKD